jgi:hypothetical protein
VCVGFCKNSFHQNCISECLCGSLSPYSDVGLSFIVKCDANIMPLLMLFSCVHKAFAKSDKIWSRAIASWCSLYFASKNSATFS